ncbi:O-antigen polymerase [Chryseobacterium kwangjuense]|uniref:Oligosaccharide repeat unit polymerase n=1 Tax=Chryseobacterium kwangjuense TaxID=267125 RepID=A0A135WIC3_9FLAO|nr:O-antigen polymerase [Chryseobacterium kwangjuense]KXH84678.1 hypothetical protein AU378_02640 [Chryseobacterium kwangjuense]
MEVNKSYKLVLFALSFLFFCIGFFIYGKISNTSYQDVYFLPIGLGFFTLFISGIFQQLKSYFIFWIITIQQIVRYIIIPFLFITGDKLRFGSTTVNEPYAVAMMLIELMFILIAYYICTYSKEGKPKKGKLNFLPLNTITTGLFFLFILIIASNRAFLHKLSFVWDIAAYLKLKVSGDLENVSPLVSIMFPVMRAYIVLFIFSVINSFKIRQGTKLMLSILVVLINATIIIGVSRFSIVYASFPLILLLIYFYPDYRRKVITYSSVFFVAILLLASLTKFSGNSKKADMGGFFSLHELNAYFGGVANYAIGYDSYQKNVVNPFDKYYYFISDITQNIPVLSKVSNDNYKTNIKFNNHIYGAGRSRDQIVPVSVAGLYHFSQYFFYIYILILSILAFRFETKAYTTNSPVLFFLYIILAFGCSTSMMINIGSLSATLFINLVVFIPFFTMINKLNPAK